jgi:hypothetical protein
MGLNSYPHMEKFINFKRTNVESVYRFSTGGVFLLDQVSGIVAG